MQFQVAIKCMVFETTHSVNYLDVTSLTLPPTHVCQAQFAVRRGNNFPASYILLYFALYSFCAFIHQSLRKSPTSVLFISFSVAPVDFQVFPFHKSSSSYAACASGGRTGRALAWCQSAGRSFSRHSSMIRTKQNKEIFQKVLMKHLDSENLTLINQKAREKTGACFHFISLSANHPNGFEWLSKCLCMIMSAGEHKESSWES